ncbi:MAG: small multi-drug export protein [Pirellulaceae bacterium]
MDLHQDLEHVDTAVVHKHVMDSFDRFELSFRRDHPIIWGSSIVGPIVGTLVILGTIWVVAGFTYMNKVLAAAFVTFFFLSRFVMLTGENADESVSFLTRGELFLMITYMDLIMAVVVTFHIGLMFKLPYIGEKIGQLVGDAQFIIKSSPWVRRLTFLGLVAFVMIPLAATGCIGGAVFGRLLGLSRGLTLLGLCLGSLAGNGVMYVGANWIHENIPLDNPWLKYGGLALIVVVIVVVERGYQRLKRRYLATLPAGTLDVSANLGEEVSSESK